LNCYVVRVFFHIVRNTNGKSGQNVTVINNIMNNLTNVYNSQLIYFVNTGNDEIRNDNYMTNFTIEKFNNLIIQNVVSNAINVYLLDNSNTFNAGRASGIPGTALVIGGSYTTPQGDTQNLVPSLVLAHEMGHCLGLYHTFETANGAELVNGSNCTTAGDLVCDTPAESPSYNFKENAACQWTTQFRDPNGATYAPLTNDIMDYIRPSCMRFFTVGQGTRMRSVLFSSSVLANVITEISLTGSSLVCNNSSTNYSIVNQPAGTTVSWQSSNTSVLNINPSGQATTSSSSGFTTINATITPGCGSISKSVYVGIPVSPSSINVSFDGCESNEYRFNLTPPVGATNYRWHYYKRPNGSETIIAGGSSIKVVFPSTGTWVVGAESVNQCGLSNLTFTNVNYNCSGGGPKVVIKPNPASTQLTISQVDTVENMNENNSINTLLFQVKIYNKFNKVVKSGKSTDGKVFFDIKELPKDIYFIHIDTGKEIIRKQVIVE
jgi:hypothetical protein